MTMNTERYLQILRKIWAALGQRRRVVRAEQWFQHDGATPHTSNDSLNWLRQFFPDRLISRRCDPEWVPHSPDLNPPDFYLWGYLKDNCTQTIHKQFLISRKRLRLKSGRFQGKSASELSKTFYVGYKCVWSVEEHIWNTSWSVDETNIFQGTDFKLC